MGIDSSIASLLSSHHAIARSMFSLVSVVDFIEKRGCVRAVCWKPLPLGWGLVTCVQAR